ncbi:hypothetical protein F4777DRAFT_578697 [Nemania sp. FL0916]|nr:hypothetical protein F4777DRAFT_578697 [Nemania sp. FL0916]
MAYSNELALGIPPLRKSTSRFDPGRQQQQQPQQYKRPQRLHPKSQPFDPDDLRRRLYVVMAEREAQDVKRQRHRVDALLPAKRAQGEREYDIQPQQQHRHTFIEHLTTSTTTKAHAMTWPEPGHDYPPIWGPASAPVSKPPPSSSSRKDKTRLRRTKIAAPSEPSQPPAAENLQTPPDASTGGVGYRHVPDQAATQFSRTTTSTGMQSKDNNNNNNNKTSSSSSTAVHRLSKAAVKFHSEGVSAADRQLIDSSITPGRQRSLIQRARTEHERLQARNQFQQTAGSPVDETAGGGGAPWRRRRSSAGVGETGVIVEEKEGTGGISALADLHLHGYPSHGEGNGNGGGNGGGDLHSSEETLVDAHTANEHRIDWAQQDEMLPSERRKSSVSVGGLGLLRKTSSSILTLKGRLTGGHSRKNSHDDTTAHGNNKHGRDGALRIVTTIAEEHVANVGDGDEQDGDDGSTPMSPNSPPSNRPGGLRIWGRLRRS